MMCLTLGWVWPFACWLISVRFADFVIWVTFAGAIGWVINSVVYISLIVFVVVCVGLGVVFFGCLW